MNDRSPEDVGYAVATMGPMNPIKLAKSADPCALITTAVCIRSPIPHEVKCLPVPPTVRSGMSCLRKEWIVK